MGRQSVQNAVLKGGDGGMLRFQTILHVDKGYIYRNTRINSSRKIIPTREARSS